jgi:hypothetical protein
LLPGHVGSYCRSCTDLQLSAVGSKEVEEEVPAPEEGPAEDRGLGAPHIEALRSDLKESRPARPVDSGHEDRH